MGFPRVWNPGCVACWAEGRDGTGGAGLRPAPMPPPKLGAWLVSLSLPPSRVKNVTPTSWGPCAGTNPVSPEKQPGSPRIRPPHPPVTEEPMSSACQGVMGGDICQPLAPGSWDSVQSGGPRVMVPSPSSHLLSPKPQICDFRCFRNRRSGVRQISPPWVRGPRRRPLCTQGISAQPRGSWGKRLAPPEGMSCGSAHG